MSGWKSKKMMSNDRFGMLVEDPFYDEDGVLIDEDADWEEIEELFEADAANAVSYDPHDTVNS